MPDTSSDARRTALVVIAHHRQDSLTAHTARQAIARLKDAKYTVDILDLYAEGFNPLMTNEDEPDWGNRDKVYAPETEAHMKRLLKADVVIAVFPVYWVHAPAILKGWIDRVWNYGFGYGRSKPRLAGKRMLWLALAGAAADEPVEIIQKALEETLSEGVAMYCGFEYSTVGLLPDAEEHRQRFNDSGQIYVAEPTLGPERDEQYRKFHEKAATVVDDFITLALKAANATA